MVDAAGRIVTPGLIESYSQLGLVEIGVKPPPWTAGESTIRPAPAFDVRYALNADSVALAVNRRDGVTRAVVAPRPATIPCRLGCGDSLSRETLMTRVTSAFLARSAAAAPSSWAAAAARSFSGCGVAWNMAGSYNPARYQPGPGDFSHQDLAALNAFGRVGPLVLTVHRADEIREAVALADDFDRRLIVVGGTEAWKVRQAWLPQEVPVVVDVLANLPISYDGSARGWIMPHCCTQPACGAADRWRNPERALSQHRPVTLSPTVCPGKQPWQP